MFVLMAAGPVVVVEASMVWAVTHFATLEEDEAEFERRLCAARRLIVDYIDVYPFLEDYSSLKEGAVRPLSRGLGQAGCIDPQGARRVKQVMFGSQRPRTRRPGPSTSLGLSCL
ncbi:MAG: hypothetical protein ACRDVP_12675 [Acidimicrobiales bacterium]